MRPLTGAWAEVAVLHLFRFAAAVLAAVLRGNARPLPGLRAVRTSLRARRPRRPVGPFAVH